MRKNKGKMLALHGHFLLTFKHLCFLRFIFLIAWEIPHIPLTEFKGITYWALLQAYTDIYTALICG
jgi:hypothetical protein